MIVAVALMSLLGCGPPRRTSIHMLDVGGVVESLAVSAEGLVAVGRYRMAIDIFEAQTGKCLRSLRGEGADFERIKAVAFSPDAPRWLAAGDSAGYVTVWDAFEGRPLARFRPHLPLFLGPTPSSATPTYEMRSTRLP